MQDTKIEQPVASYGNPQIEDGHTRIANELLEAIIRFDFSKRQLKVVFFVIRKTYGYNKKKDDMSLTQIVNGTGLDRAHASSTVNELVAMKVLLKQQGQYAQSLAVNKKYGDWHELPKQQPVAKTAIKGLPKQQFTVAKTATTKDKPKNNTKRHIPADFSISDSVREWAKKNGFDRLEERLEHFKDWANGGGKMYVDWDSTFRNAIRGDWAHLGEQPKSSTPRKYL